MHATSASSAWRCLVFLARMFRWKGLARQKESLFCCFVAKSKFFPVLADMHSFLSTPNRKVFLTFICACLLFLTKIPQNCRLFSAIARIACRSKHFFSPQGAARLSACRRILFLIPEAICPKSKIPACFFPLVFLFASGKPLSKKKQKDS